MKAVGSNGSYVAKLIGEDRRGESIYGWADGLGFGHILSSKFTTHDIEV